MKRFLLFPFIAVPFFLVANAWATPFIIENVVASTGEPYELGFLSVGSEYYIDRSYTITSQPEGFENHTAILTANDDKRVTADDHLMFTLLTDATIYVAYDKRGANTPPLWLSENFTKTSYEIAVTDGSASPLQIWERGYADGQVILGGNHAGGDTGARSNYLVYAEAAQAAPTPEPATLLLIGSGLLGLAGFRRKFRKR